MSTNQNIFFQIERENNLKILIEQSGESVTISSVEVNIIYRPYCVGDDSDYEKFPTDKNLLFSYAPEHTDLSLEDYAVSVINQKTSLVESFKKHPNPRMRSAAKSAELVVSVLTTFKATI